MSEESTTPDLEGLSRQLNEASNRRDMEGALALYSPDAVWDMSALGLGIHKGHDALRGFFEDWTRAYGYFEQALEQFRDMGNGVTFTVYLQRARPTGSGGLVDLRYANVRTWADGLIEWNATYTDIDEARAAAERLAEERG
jgi:ketosteroid isomerase-like protein